MDRRDWRRVAANLADRVSGRTDRTIRPKARVLGVTRGRQLEDPHALRSRSQCVSAATTGSIPLDGRQSP